MFMATKNHRVGNAIISLQLNSLLFYSFTCGLSDCCIFLSSKTAASRPSETPLCIPVSYLDTQHLFIDQNSFIFTPDFNIHKTFEDRRRITGEKIAKFSKSQTPQYVQRSASVSRKNMQHGHGTEQLK